MGAPACFSLGEVCLISCSKCRNQFSGPPGSTTKTPFICSACTSRAEEGRGLRFDRYQFDPAFRRGLRRDLRDAGLLTAIDPARERRQDAPEWATQIAFLKLLCTAHSNGLINIERRMACLHWRYALDWSLIDIAASLGMTVGSTKAMLRQLRKRGDTLWVKWQAEQAHPATKRLRALERVLEKAEPGKPLERLRIISEGQQCVALPRTTFPTPEICAAASAGNKAAEEFLQWFEPRRESKSLSNVEYI